MIRLTLLLSGRRNNWFNATTVQNGESCLKMLSFLQPGIVVIMSGTQTGQHISSILQYSGDEIVTMWSYFRFFDTCKIM